MSSAIPFRPRSVSELVDAAFQLLRRHYAQFVMLMGIAYVPWLVIVMVTTRSLLGDPGAAALEGGVARMMLLAVGGLIWFSMIDGAMTVAASQGYLGKDVDVGNAFQRAFAQIGALVGVAIVRGLVVALGFLLFVIPGFYLLARYFAAPAAVVLERIGIGRAMSRSSTLTDGYKWHVLKTLLLVWVIYLVLSIALAAIVGGILAAVRTGGAADNPISPSIMQVVSALFTILIYPLVAIVQTLLYYDLRIRKEGYDIELMAGDLTGVPAGQPTY